MHYYRYLRPFIFQLSPETAHEMVIKALEKGLVPKQEFSVPESLAITLFEKKFIHPVGLAAGFDKNAACIHGLSKQGFSFIEVGTVTPKAQAGNPKPRLFRLTEDEAIINRMGFNNHGITPFLKGLQSRPEGVIVGANIGKNKDSEDAVADYVMLFERLYGEADYITVNISSPNTPGLRALQSLESLEGLLSALHESRVKKMQALPKRKVPLFVKIAPDLEEASLPEMAQCFLKYAIDGVIISNTTITRPSLQSRFAAETGGLSGRPLFNHSTALLSRFYQLTEGKLPLIGVGGIRNGKEAYLKIRAGASLIQLYSVLIYRGFEVVSEIVQEVATLLAQDGFSHISEAIGRDAL